MGPLHPDSRRRKRCNGVFVLRKGEHFIRGEKSSLSQCSAKSRMYAVLRGSSYVDSKGPVWSGVYYVRLTIS